MWAADILRTHISEARCGAPAFVVQSDVCHPPAHSCPKCEGMNGDRPHPRFDLLRTNSYARLMFHDNGFLSGFDVQQVCLNGHIVTNFAKSSPKDTEKFCSRCGEETVLACPACKTWLRGNDHDSNVIIGYYVPPPSYCYNCGVAFPWVQRQLESASELVAESELLSEHEKFSLTNTFKDLMTDTPKTPLAVSRFRRLISKAGEELQDGLHKILVHLPTNRYPSDSLLFS
jgi:hypothetical protein